ncbi:MAG TPA: hypothetical protein VFS20_21815 [Longimicrobium sp.]|nr:hypothetical protein [Longimicrobium sp.]
MRIHTAVWSMDLALGWHVQDHGDHVVIEPEEPDSTLRLTSIELPGEMTAATWVERVANAQLPKGRRVVEAGCGDFRGIRTEFAMMDPNVPPRSDDRWVRVWSLACDGTPLDITYRCPLRYAGRQDQQVVAMLDTLRAEPRVRRSEP